MNHRIVKQWRSIFQVCSSNLFREGKNAYERNPIKAFSEKLVFALVAHFASHCYNLVQPYVLRKLLDFGCCLYAPSSRFHDYD